MDIIKLYEQLRDDEKLTLSRHSLGHHGPRVLRLDLERAMPSGPAIHIERCVDVETLKRAGATDVLTMVVQMMQKMLDAGVN